MAEPALHIKLEFNTASHTHIVEHYALDEATLRKAHLWLANELTPRDTEQFSSWLFIHGGKYDRADGPARIITSRGGIRRGEWWVKGEFIKQEIIADLSTIPGVTVLPPSLEP